MDSKTTSIVTYLTLIGFIVAISAGTKDEYSAQHMNNSIVNMIFCFAAIPAFLLTIIPIIGWLLLVAGWLWLIFLGVCTIIGFIKACMGQPFETPLIGKIKIIKA